MEKPKRWHFFLILSVLFLTLYNIAPTILYYTKPLKSLIDEPQSKKIAQQILKRVDLLEQDAEKWVASFCRLIQVTPSLVKVGKEDPEHLYIHFQKTEEAARFRSFLPRAGLLISSAPNQLSLAYPNETGKEVVLQRKISVRLADHPELFSYMPVDSESYRTEVIQRAAQVAALLTGPTDLARDLSLWEKKAIPEPPLQAVLDEIQTLEALYKENSSACLRLLSRFTKGDFSNRAGLLEALATSMDQVRDRLKTIEEKGEREKALETKLFRAAAFLKAHRIALGNGDAPIPKKAWEARFEEQIHDFIPIKTLLFSHIYIDWEQKEIQLVWQDDLASLREGEKMGPLFQQLVMAELARIGKVTGETVKTVANGIALPLHKMEGTSSVLTLDLQKIGSLEQTARVSFLKDKWHPRHLDLQEIGIMTAEEYVLASPHKKALCLVIYAPIVDQSSWEEGLDAASIYIIPKGIDTLAEAYRSHPESERAQTFLADLRDLETLLAGAGFQGSTTGREFAFEKPHFYRPLIEATREAFVFHGNLPRASLELSNIEQRILTENKIETAIHSDLMKWEEEYRAAQVSPNPALRFDVPAPTRSIFWNNALLSARKFFRGDERKILRWGLDLSGGKSVQIELRDDFGHVVMDDVDLKQGIQELQKRVNRLGLSEVSIRQLGHHIVLDFPGSQALSASELIQSSSMHFHVVNEKFSPSNPELGSFVNRFLQEVWNEAYVTHRMDAASVEEIARKQLEMKGTESAQVLQEAGLRFQTSLDTPPDASICKLAILRGDGPRDWYGQTHPLLIVFAPCALQGADLDQIQSAYDPSKGNYLSFTVKSGYVNGASSRTSPQQELHRWTSLYSKETIIGTENERFSQGRGWRMAVILNNIVISAPVLESALRDSAMISGSFTQREVQKLAADLKAGSLTFTPHILSEKNISPELGKADRSQGITATFFSLVLVIATMLLWYRFAGLVASVAVLFNLLILWAVLQNLGATLTLGGIAGIILTVGMAVDANVLVFERVKEEFGRTKNIKTALSAGYKMAFSAILDSNITTILAALILLNFDAGPIKSFAINLIIGVASSMFTALFMTRTFFQWWVSRGKEVRLTMPRWIEGTKGSFLKHAKLAFGITVILIGVGGFLLVKEKSSIFGMDFTGGYALHLEVEPVGDEPLKIEAALKAKGLGSQDFQVKTLSASHQLRLLFAKTLDNEGKPFAHLGLENAPRLEWVQNALKEGGLVLSQTNQTDLESQWTKVSGQMSDHMRDHALLGLGLAFIAMFIYLAFRFEYKFAAAALLCLFHDVVITLAVIGILFWLKVPIQIDLSTVAALMTIIGYSINDTIIIFDRIREDQLRLKNSPLSEIVEGALRSTLSRTIMTSGTTLLVLLALVGLGGASIFSFSLVMAIGVILGTLSSWFIASPLMLLFHKREEKALMERH